MGEIIFHVVIMVITAIFYQQSYQINMKRMVDSIGPAGFPRAILILAFVLTVISLFFTIKKYKEKAAVEKRKKLKEFDTVFGILIVSIILFVLLVNYTGFFTASLVLVTIIMYILGQKSLKKLFIMAPIIALSYALLFGRLLHVPLPRGSGVFKMISYLFY